MSRPHVFVLVAGSQAQFFNTIRTVGTTRSRTAQRGDSSRLRSLLIPSPCRLAPFTRNQTACSAGRCKTYRAGHGILCALRLRCISLCAGGCCNGSLLTRATKPSPSRPSQMRTLPSCSNISVIFRRVNSGFLPGRGLLCFTQ